MANFREFKVGDRKVYTYIDENLKQEHKNIKHTLTCHLPDFPECVGAYVKGRPMTHSVGQHINNSYFLKMDIKKFFNNIDLKILDEELSREFNGEDCVLYRELRKAIKQSRLELDKGLIQGSVLAPLLSNVFMKSIDSLIMELLSELGHFNYTRYSDDMTISSKEPFNHITIILAITGILTAHGLEVNTKKTQFITKDTHNHVKLLGYNIIFGSRGSYIKEKPRRKKINNHSKGGYERMKGLVQND